eukprot:TRINITY_DN8373_c0_g1_i1.p1 TRINITY_DN8373_c0_g1~~TRINITY_DN8373_c0_g1_i1.p1  ORF type:complete len:207 (-),score=37.88 TRINITY_DN8373_c0_g1_i1:9-569(-)
MCIRDRILIVISMQSASVSSIEEFKRISCQIREVLRADGSYEVVYTHIEVLESIILQSSDLAVQREALFYICEYAKIVDESLFAKVKDQSWMIRERAYHTLLQMEQNGSRLYRNDLLSSVKEVIDERRKNEKHEYLRRELQNSTEIVKVYLFIDNTLTTDERNFLDALQTVRNSYLQKYGQIKLTK